MVSIEGVVILALAVDIGFEFFLDLGAFEVSSSITALQEHRTFPAP
jgi:hypothetical protein